MGDATTTAVNAITSRSGHRRFVASAAAMPIALGAMHNASAQATVFDQLISEDVARLAERCDAGEHTQAPSSAFVIYLSKTSVVHTVDTTSSKYRHLPPTALQLARLAKNSRATKPEAEPWVDDEFVARNLRRRLGPKVIGELVARYNAGEHTPALAKEYEISTTGLRKLLLEEGVELRLQSIAPEDSDRAVELYESGLTIRDVVKEIGYSLGSIRRELHRRGVPMRPSGRWNHLAQKCRTDITTSQPPNLIPKDWH